MADSANPFADPSFGKDTSVQENPFSDPEFGKPSGLLRKIADKGLGFASGAVGATKAIADATGAGNRVSGALGEANTFLNDNLSPEAKADQQEQSTILAAAKGQGAWEGVKAGFNAFGVAPVQTAVQGLGSIVPVIAGGLAGVPGAVATGVAMGAGTAKGAIYDEIKRRGGSEAEAAKAQEYGGANTDQIALGGALGAADAATGVTRIAGSMLRNAVGKPVVQAATAGAERGLLGRAGMGLLGEMPLEAMQGGQEQVAANLAAQRAGYEAGTWDNVAGNATLEALASAGPGAMFGALDRKAVAPEPIAPTTPEQLTAESNQANNELGAVVDQANDIQTQQQIGYNGQSTPNTIIPENVSGQPLPRNIVEVERQDGQGTTVIDRTTGPLSNIAADAVEGGLTDEYKSPKGAPLFPFPNAQAAQAHIDGREDADRLTITAHPNVKGRMAVVPKDAQTLRTMDAKAAAQAANETRTQQVESEDGNAAPETPQGQVTFAGRDTASMQSPKGAPVTNHFTTAQGSEYIQTADGMTQRNKSVHANTGGVDAGVHGWNDSAVFIDPSHVVAFNAPFGTTVQRLQEAGNRIAIQQKDGVISAQIYDKATKAWRVATTLDAFPAAVKAGLMAGNEQVATSYTDTPTVGHDVFEYTNRPDGRGVSSVHAGSPVATVTPVGQQKATVKAPADAKAQTEQALSQETAQDELQAPVAQPAGTMPGAQKMGAKMANAARIANETRAAALAQEEGSVQIRTASEKSGNGQPSQQNAQSLPGIQAAESPRAASLPERTGPFSPETAPTAPGSELQARRKILEESSSANDTAAQTLAQDAAQAEINQSTGKESKTRSPRQKGESDAAYMARRATEANQQKQQTAQQPKTIPTKGSDTEAARAALGKRSNGTEEAVAVAELPDAPQAGANEVSKQAATFIGHVAKLFGKRVVFVKGMDADGMRNAGNNIYLSTQSSVAHLRVFGHEMLHALKAQNPDAYKNMLDAVQHLLTDKEYAAQYENYFGEAMPEGHLTDKNRAFLAEEWMADLSGNRFAEEGFWKDVFTQVEATHGPVAAKGIIARLRLAIVNALQKLLKLVNGNEFAVDQRMGENLELIRKAVADGFAQYAVAVKDKQLVDEGVGEAKFSPGTDAPVIQHQMEIERETRELAASTRLSASEQTAIGAEAKRLGITKAKLELEVRRIKAQFPTAGGWAPMEFSKVNKLKYAKKKGVLSMDTVEFQKQPYDFHLGSSGKDDAPTRTKRVSAMAKGISDELGDLLKKAGEGDKNAKITMDQIGWYSKVATMLHHQFGGFADFLAQLMGPTSANTPVEGNVKYAMAALKSAMSGKWDSLIADTIRWHEGVMQAAAGLDAVIEANRAKPKAERLSAKDLAQTQAFKEAMHAVEAAAPYTGEEPQQDSGAKFGMATQGVVEILANTWSDFQRGDAPKTKNYYQNLIGRQFTGATIDVWAARTLRRMAGMARLPTSAEKGVAGKIGVNLTPGAEFGFGQSVFTKAAENLRNSGIAAFANTTPADVQAMIWFSEKENWARNDWTNKIGEGGSAEAEFNLQGNADREGVEEARRLSRKGLPHSGNTKPNKTEEKVQQASIDAGVGQFPSPRETPQYKARLEKIIAKAVAARNEARVQFESMRGAVDRWIAGVTPATDFTPSDATMAEVGAELESKVAMGEDADKVLAFKAFPTMGRYGYDERSIDFEGATRQGYYGADMLGPLLEVARDYAQDGLLFGRVLRSDEDIDYLRHRPGMELYLAKGTTMDKAQPLLDKLDQLGFKQFTFVVDPVRTPEALSGKMGNVVGLRYIFTPEFSLREPNPEYGGDQTWSPSALTDDQIRDRMVAKSAELDLLADQLRGVPGVSSAELRDYEANVYFWGDYDNALRSIASQPGQRAEGQQWQGDPVRAGLERADRRREVDPGSEDAKSFAARRDVLRGDTKLSPQRAGPSAQVDGPDGRRAREHAVNLTATHFSQQTRSSLDGRYNGTGLKGAEAKRLAESSDSRIKERVYFYIDEGNGLTPEAGVGGVAHTADLKDIYNVKGDPLKLFKSGDLNGSESRVLDAGFNGYYFPNYVNGQGIAVVLGNATRGIQVTPTGYAKGQAPVAQPVPYKRGLTSKELNAIDLTAVQAAAPSAKLRMGTFTVDQDQLEAARAEMAKQGIDLPEAKFSSKRAAYLVSDLNGGEWKADPQEYIGKEQRGWVAKDGSLRHPTGVVLNKNPQSLWYTAWFPSGGFDATAGRNLITAKNSAIQSANEKFTESVRLWEKANPYIRYSNKRQPFYSALAKEVGALKMQGAPAFGWRDALKGLVNKGLIKQDEVEWSGLNDWLELQTGKVAREQVVQYLDANGVQVNETVLRDPESNVEDLNETLENLYGYGASMEYGEISYTDEDGDDVSYRDLPIQVKRLVDEHDKRTGGSAKYEQYNLPGGSNYREVLLTLPEKIKSLVWYSRMEAKYGKAFKYSELTPSERAEVTALSTSAPPPSYKSSHWDQPNVLAHLRVDDRTDADGNKVLMVQELQSDWGQDGKKKGFKETASEKDQRTRALNKKTRELEGKWDAKTITPDENTELERLIRERNKGWPVDDGIIPTAPFVTTTPGWLNLALKRVITMAVQGGYDKVAFVNGEQSAERYSLGGQIDTLIFDPADGKVIGRKGGSQVVTKSINHTSELTDLVGKEITDRLLASPKNGYGMHELSGVDLELGGEGMKAFYDKIVPNATSALLKKLGGGKLEMIDLTPWDPNTELDKWEAEDGEGDGSKAAVVQYTQPGFTITPAMQEKAAGGLPMFSPKRSASNVFGKDIAPVAIKAYQSLSGEAKNIIDGWNVNWHKGQDRLHSLEAWAEVLAAYAPVRDKLRHVYGDTIPAYRGEKRSDTESGMDRFLFSWTPLRDVATGFAINRTRGMPVEITQAQVDEQIQNYKRTGIARLNGYKFVRKHPPVGYTPDGPDYYYIYHRDEMLTDGDDLVDALRSEKSERDEYINALRQKGTVYTAAIPVDSVAFIPVGANLHQPEFVAEYNPRTKAADNIRFSKKRIVGDRGRVYTAAQLAAMDNTGARVAEPTLQERAQALWKDAGKKMAQGIADQFAPVRALDGKAYGLLRLAKGASGAFEALLQGGKLKLDENVYDIDTANRGGVVDRLLKPLQGEHHDFMRWVAAHRAEKLMGQGKENLFTPADIAAFKTLADGTTSFDYKIQNGIRAGQTTRNRAEIYRDAQATFNGFNKNVLDMAEQSGLIDGSTRHLWESEFYVPFYREADDDTGGVRGMNIKGGSVRQKAFEKLKGGKDKLNADLLDNTLMNWAHLLDASAKNRAAKATIEAAERMGIAMSGNQTALAQMGASIHNKNGVVWFMDGGIKRYSLIDNQGDGPYIMTALTSLEYAGMRNPVMNAMGAFKHALTVGVTASPFFKVRNLIRDSVQVIGTGPISYNVAKNLGEGWKLTDPKSDAYFRLLAGGGTIHFGTMLEGSEAKRVQALVESGIDDATILNNPAKVKAFYRKYVEPSITAYNELGNRGEAVNRASLYDQLRKQGMGHAEASLQARDLMDFSMQGSWTSVRFFTQVVPFMNARIQGMYKLGKAAKGDPARFGTVLGATALFSLALLAAYSDDDDWKKRSESDRNNWWWFKVGGTSFRIPKPFEIGAIGTLAERGFELAFDKEMTNKRFMGQVMTLLGDNLSMNPVPQLVKPMMDVYANTSYSGMPIENMAQQRLQSEYRFSDRTSMFARGLSTTLNAVTGVVGKEALSPVQIDHMLQGYFGWLGTMVVSSADVLARPATDQPKQATPDYLKVLTGGMVNDLRDAPSRYVSQLYTQAKEIEKAYGTWRNLQREGKVDDAKAFFDDNKDTLLRYHQVQNAKKSETLFNNMIRMVERNTMMSADDKRARIRAIQVQKNEVAKRVSSV